jgi:hypothetical protein
MTHLERVSNEMAALFGCRVYLVSHALTDEHARDTDIRAWMPDMDFYYRYQQFVDESVGIEELIKRWLTERATGEFTQLYWTWAYEMRKYSRHFQRVTGRNVDFQVHPATAWKPYLKNPRRRLDAAPDSLLKHSAQVPPEEILVAGTEVERRDVIQ